ncbi:MAG TPA: hypothetical protein PK720_02740 [bacterium]|nr:hypothetical protein [bacterium]
MYNTLRKISIFALVAITVISISGFSASQVKAAALPGSLIKSTNSSAVYYLASNNSRYVFPDVKTYMTWYRDFSGVNVISQAELETYPLGGNITYRPGTRLVKTQAAAGVYAVGYNRTLHSIVSEANAIAMWGPMWNKMINDVPEAFFTNYVVGAPLALGMYGEGQLVMHSGNPDVYYYDGSAYRKFANENSFTGNRFSFAHVATAPVSLAFTPIGSPVSGIEANLINTSGGASSSASTGTGLSVALSSDTPASASIPKGATGVNYTKFNVTASNDGDIILQTVTVSRMGVGTPGDFEYVYLYDGMNRLTTGRSINSSTNKATFNNLNLTVAKGTTKTLWIAADMLLSGSTGSGSSSLGISAASDIVAGGATVTGSFPVMGNVMGLTNVSGGSIVIAKTGSLTNPKAGEIGAKVASFKLTAGSAEDLKVTGVTLYNSGTVQSDKLSNFVLKQAGTTVATASTMSSNSNIMLNFSSPFMMEKGASRTFELYADISATARKDETITIYLDNSADLHTVGQTYGFGASVDRTAYDAGDASTTTIQAGQVTLSFQGPSVQDLAVQQQDVELFRFTIVAQSNIEIRNTHLNLTAAGGSNDNDLTDAEGLLNLTVPNYTDIKFVDSSSNQLVAGPKDLTASGNDLTQTLDYTDIWNVNAGQTRTIKVTADVANYTPASDETIKATLNTFTTGADIKNLDTNQFLVTADIVPSTNIAGNTHRVKSGSVTVALSGTPSAQTYINGSTAVKMTGLNITAGTGKDIKVSSVMFTAVGANSCATETDCVLNVKLWDGATQVGQTKSLASNNTVTFDNLNVMIPKGTTKTLTVSVDLNTLSSVAGSTTLRLNVASTDDVVAEDVDGNSITVSGTVSGPNHTVASAGSLTVALGPDDSETESRIILAGKTDETVARYRFTAANESLKLTRVTIELPASTDDEVTSVSLWDGATKVTGDVAVTSAGTPYAKFNSFTTDFVIPKDSTKTLTVKVNTNTVGNGADSGTTVTATLATDTSADDQFEARGVSSNTVLDDDDVTQTSARAMVLRKTKMTVTENAIASSIISNGSEQEVYNFTVSADANENVSLKQLILDAVITDNVGTNDTLVAGSLKLYRGSTNLTSNVDIHNLVGTTLETAATIAEGTSQVVITWASDEEVIAAGTSNTYSIRATLSGYSTPADDDTFRMLLKTDATAQTATNTYLVDLDTTVSQQTAALADITATTIDGTEGTTAVLAANGNFIWSDNSGVPHDYDLVDSVLAGTDSTSGSDWINGYLLKNFPMSGKTLNN